MFGFFKKKKSNEREKVIEQFNSNIDQIKNADESAQMVVGHGINMANSVFLQTYSTPDDFRNRSLREKDNYFKKYSNFALGVKEQDLGMFMGAHFFGTWLLALVQDDDELEQLVKKELAWLSKKGELM